jgi:two-component system NtrC family sensor kinase
VAHELNNPLTAMIGFSDLLSETSEDEKIRPHLEIIAKSAHRCHKIVHNLLSFARQHAPERKLTGVNGTIDEVLEIMIYDLRTSNIKIVRDFAPRLPPIMADPHQLQQVFVNIVGNARQAIQAFRPDGMITVRTREEGGWIRIELIDNGPGIKPENLSRVFDPFFTTKAVGKGTGLGLSLVYGIVKEHGGRIRVESALGNGATFVIELPVAAGEASLEAGADAQHHRPWASASSGKSVLVVDDEEWILVLARELLNGDGHAVETAKSGEEAAEALRRQKFDVVICDWKMPGMNGMQLFEHLEATDPTAAERVLFMSGDVINDTFQEFLNLHRKTCLPKPFPIEEFREAVAKMLAA